MALLSDHRILVTGVLTDDSLAFGIAKRALEEGGQPSLCRDSAAECPITRRTAKKLGDVGEIIELDVMSPEQIASAVDEVTSRFGRLDGLVHAIGYAPPSCLGSGMFRGPLRRRVDRHARVDPIPCRAGRRLSLATAKERRSRRSVRRWRWTLTARGPIPCTTGLGVNESRTGVHSVATWPAKLASTIFE